MTNKPDFPGASQFTIALIEKTPSQDSDAQNWYRYVLENGGSTIEGKRSGSLKEVTAYVNEYVEHLNSRSTMIQSTWTTRSKKPEPEKKAEAKTSKPE